VALGAKKSAPQIHSILKETLQALGAKAMVVGHTPQTLGVNWYEAMLN
jgi:hypothetical protein